MPRSAELDTRVGDLLFRRGLSALVVMKGSVLVSYVDWPGRPKRRPQTQDEMDHAIEDWFEKMEAELT
jgi:hypothetical protein